VTGTTPLILDVLFPAAERHEFAAAVVNSYPNSAHPVLARLNEALAGCCCQLAPLPCQN
jgi:hypothetical protein